MCDQLWMCPTSGGLQSFLQHCSCITCGKVEHHRWLLQASSCTTTVRFRLLWRQRLVAVGCAAACIGVACKGSIVADGRQVELLLVYVATACQSARPITARTWHISICQILTAGGLAI
jgi:hypothetical protein